MRQSVLGSGRTQWGWVHACSCTNECGEGHIGESHGNPLCSPVWIEYIDFYHSKIASLLCDLWQMPRMPSLPQVYHIFMASETHQQGWLNNSQSKWSKSITVADPRHLHFSSQENIPHVFAAKQQDGLSAFPCGTILQEIRRMMFLCDQFGVLFYAILFFCIFGFPSAILSFTNTTDSIRHYATSARRVEGKRVAIWSKDMWCMAVFPCFSMLFLHVICCWYYPRIRNPTAVVTRSRDWIFVSIDIVSLAVM